jgi:hypothetical protein
LARLDLVADAHSPGREVGVQRRVPVAEGDLDDVPVALESGTLAHGDHAAG